jgi:hypothetical protein
MVNCIMNLLTGVYWRWTITVHGMIFNRYWSLFLLLRVNNCVGYSNYKYFYLFLMYTLILGIWFCLTSLYDIIQLWTGGLQGDAATVANKFNVTFCVIIVGIFCLSTSTLFFYHTYLIVVNKTTIGKDLSIPSCDYWYVLISFREHGSALYPQGTCEWTV